MTPLPVDSGEAPADSADIRGPALVKLFAKSGGANKPRVRTPYNLLQTLFL